MRKLLLTIVLATFVYAPTLAGPGDTGGAQPPPPCLEGDPCDEGGSADVLPFVFVWNGSVFVIYL